MNLQGKVAWITGGARMGDTVAGAFTKLGCRVVFTYRKSREAAEASAQKVISGGGEAAAFQCDLSLAPDILKTCQAIVDRFTRLDILINLASIYQEAGVQDFSEATRSLESHFKANTESAYNLSVAVAPWMKKNGEGRIVHISDWTSASERPRYKNLSAYYVSKASIKGIVEAMALELAPEILVNGIAPGPILPPPGLTEKELQDVENATPLGRWGGADEIAKAVLFLIETDFVTGETIRVDGGRHLS